MARKFMTKETVIELAEKMNGTDRFDYENIKYYGIKNPLAGILCKRCGEKFQVPSATSHIHHGRHGCPQCDKDSTYKITRGKFIDRSEAAHGNGEYDYTHVDFKGMATYVSIVHNECGKKFHTAPQVHITGYGKCPSCHPKFKRGRPPTQFSHALLSCERKYGNAYSYDREGYAGMTQPTTITCNRCQEDFVTTMSLHIGMGRECPTCGPARKDKIVK